MKVSPEEQTGQFEPQKKTIGKAKDKSTESMRSEYQRETESGQINRASETRGTPRPVMSNSVQPHGLQHARPPCPSPAPGAHLSSFMSITSVMPTNHLSLCHPLLLLPSIFPSIRGFSNGVSQIYSLFSASFLSQTDPSFDLNTKSSPHGKTLLPI